MKTIFIPAKSKQKLDTNIIGKISKQTPNKIAICYSIQFEQQAKDLQNRLNKLKNKQITAFKQVLGCSKPIFPKNTQALILIGQGKFHSVSLQYETKIPVYLVENNKLTKVSQQDVEKLEKKQKASYVNYLHQDKVGILITNKPGQQRLKQAIKLKNKLKKKTYLFICNELKTSEFENFGLKSWVNTACPRLDLDDYRIINGRDPFDDKIYQD